MSTLNGRSRIANLHVRQQEVGQGSMCQRKQGDVVRLIAQRNRARSLPSDVDAIGSLRADPVMDGHGPLLQ